jgi:linoleoyl-CoA desaturase
LNFQIEHHLFPRICHVNYSALSKLVEGTCREFGVAYLEHKSFWAGVAAHNLVAAELTQEPDGQE